MSSTHDISHSGSGVMFARLIQRCVCGCRGLFRLSSLFNKTAPETERMKRSASTSFEEGKEAERIKKITKSLPSKKLASKQTHPDDLPSPVRVKKEAGEKPLEPVAVQEGPTAKELAAAKAARIRLGYEQEDTSIDTHVMKTDAGLAFDGDCQDMIKCPTGSEPMSVEATYPTTEELEPLDEPEEMTQDIVTRLSSKDWQEMCRSLNVVRQLAIHHTSSCLPLLPLLVPAVLKLFKNPRSSVCKTAVLCLTDMIQFLKDEMIPHIDIGGPAKPVNSLLCQLLLKSTTDKQFVAEEIQKSLTVMTSSLDVVRIIPLLMPYASHHKNPNVRGKAGFMLTAATDQLTEETWKTVAAADLLKTSAVLITDRTPEARDAARSIIFKLRSHFHSNTESGPDGAVTVKVCVVDKGTSDKEGDVEDAPPDAWKIYCEEHLSMTQAIAVLKVQSQ